MNLRSVCYGGIAGGIVAALVMTAAGKLLGVTLAPWSSLSLWSGYLGHVIEWSETAAVLVPICALLGIPAAFVCALVFEYVTERAGWRTGAVIGLLLGVSVSAIVALIPWLAWRFGYAYTPPDPPLGPFDVSWPFLALAAAGTIFGSVIGAWYGSPRHDSRARPSLEWREIYRAD